MFKHRKRRKVTFQVLKYLWIQSDDEKC